MAFGRSGPSNLLVVANGGALVLGVFSAAVQARILGPVGRGELAVAVVPATVIAMLLCLGLPDYFARRVALDGDVRRAATMALVLSAAIGVLTVGPYLGLGGLLAPVGSEAWWLLGIYAILTPVFVYGYCISAISVGQGSWIAVAASKILPQVLGLAGLLAIWAMSPSVLQVGSVLLAATLCGLLIPASIAGAYPWRRFDAADVKAALRFGIHGWGAGALALVNQRIDLLMLTVMATHDELGLYAVSVTLASVLGTIPVSIALPTRNRVARGDHEAAVEASSFSIFVTFILGVGVIASLPWLVPLALGEAFAPAIPTMIVLIAAQVPLAGIVILTFSIVGAGRPAAPLYGEATALILTVVAILLLFPTYGPIAAALANLFANVVSLGVLIVLSRRHLARVPAWRYVVPSPSQLRRLITRKGSSEH